LLRQRVHLGCQGLQGLATRQGRFEFFGTLLHHRGADVA
jgi:hypothetical protein